jgi:iron complex outermembrane receptor protein
LQRSITRHGTRPGNHIGSLLLATVALIGAAPVAMAQAPQPPAPPATPPETPPPDGAPEQTPAQTPPEQTPAQAPDPAPPPAPVADRTIAGTVLDQDTGVPLAGATVTLVETGQSTVADDLGAFSFSGLTPGSYTLSASLGGYIAADVPVDASAAAPGPVTLMLASDPSFGEVIVIVGSRTERSVLESPVPVDVIDSAMLRQGGHSETGQALAALAPSYQASHQTVSDGSDHVVPASMRGLGPDQVLVLLNGKRRHSTALLHATDNFGRGATGVDLDAIPLSAIERIEVLRDGAAAQYGSDAIAGVINIVLKDQVGVLDAMATTGITGRGDGLTTRVGANYGVAVGDGGVLSVTGEFVQRGETNRADPWQGPFFPGLEGEGDYDQTTDMLEQNGLSREDVRMRVGQSQATVGHLFLNGKLPLDGVDLYTFGGATYREGDAAGFYRTPLDEDRVDFDRYPLGFLPRIHPTIIDWALGFGGRTEIEGWKLDLSANHGGNVFLWEIRNSVNASLGAAAGGTTFDAGGLGFLQTNLNADVVRGLDVAWVEKLSLVAGAELRVENFRQMAGEEASWIDGGLTTPGGAPKVPGSQVFPGYQADLSEYRRSVGAYVGLESELTERILLDVAGRFEHYNDFGSTLTGKLASRFEVTDKLALRAAVSNGFRAPSLHQIWFTAVSTQFEVVNGVQTAKQALLANNSSEIAQSFGIPGLEEETSINLSAGVTAQPIPGLSLTADVYRIDLQDRIVYSSRLSSNPDDYPEGPLRDATEQVALLLPDDVSQVEFFVNAVDTSTMGLDLVAEYKLPVAEGVLGVTGAANFTRSEVVDFHIPASVGTALSIADADTARKLLFSDQEQNRIEDLLPWQKGTLGLSYGRGPWNAMTRARYYGSSYYVGYAEDGSENESYSPKILFDLEVGHRFENGLSLAIGAENLLNTFPDESKNEANRYYDQFIYRPDQFGMNGGFYYLRLNFVQ